VMTGIATTSFVSERGKAEHAISVTASLSAHHPEPTDVGGARRPRT
jgi:hypothetical protein